MARLTKDEQQAYVTRARQNDAEAFERLYADAVPVILRSLYGLVNPDDAEDIAQETIAKAFQKLELFDEASSFSTWTVSIARNLAISHLRSASRERDVIVDSIDRTMTDEQGNSFTMDAPYDDLAISRREAEMHVRLGMEGLSGEQRVAITLFLEGDSLVEIGKVIGRPVATVKTVLHRAKQSMRKTLTPVTA